MHIHILGISGTFMGSLAVLAKDSGATVTGSDLKSYPPISDQLEDLNIKVIPNYDIDQLQLKPDLFVIGNVMSRGMPIIEQILTQNLPYTSGPRWLKDNILDQKQVIAVSGTHGKTTIASLIAFILKDLGADPGYLIGGIPIGFDRSSNIGTGPIFIVEADEYDTAFFDKRSKFIHYKSDVLLINNIEFDHVDIFNDVDQIIWQFHQLLRTLSPRTRIIANGDDLNIQKLFALGVWSEIDYFGSSFSDSQKWTCALDDHGQYNLSLKGKKLEPIHSKLFGQHNMLNVTAAIASLSNLGLNPRELMASAQNFIGVKRRLEYLGKFSNIHLFDDFAHHPTAIKASMAAMKSKFHSSRLYAVVELASNTMRKGSLKSDLKESFHDADFVWILDFGDAEWDIQKEFLGIKNVGIAKNMEDLSDQLWSKLKVDDSLVIMTNKDSVGIRNILIKGPPI
ncbi:MAG: UDP-N-acetylmuramate:L-alanyl-gamma-D-glutamyl-meso-diaminopimelate ligase [Gammaproteobacteria bacterium]|jgi:UDP-N-acetylmuramate: L-alanyl-gamma-D-glutamyl-meso-diaminopimelate ligase|nr:UDP-N-acetylmuramate:L-alanyl-gamma-D-glutamyl-meso-diaminopimelate ligase [Gammaproteobacteria bacterium]